MLKVYNIKDKIEYLREVVILEHNEWAKNPQEFFEDRIDKKIEKVKNNLNKNDFCKLILLDDNKLIGFISLFPNDGDERRDLSPWYATMYVKKEYRNKGYSKILNKEILREAQKRGYKRIYLKTDLNNYYEKFGANYMEKLSNGEKLYYIDLKENNYENI